MDVLLTASSGLFLIIGIFCAYIACRAQDVAQQEARLLRAQRAKIAELESAIETLTEQHKKLSGRFYRLKASIDVDAEEPEEQPTQLTLLPGAVCENYLAAQRQGPRSEAAKCDCGFCSAMRARRAAQRAALIPATAAGQAAMAEENSRGG